MVRTLFLFIIIIIINSAIRDWQVVVLRCLKQVEIDLMVKKFKFAILYDIISRSYIYLCLNRINHAFGTFREADKT